MNREGSESPKHGDSNILGSNSYTTQRLKHATPEHLHLTSRRCFIGPIPEGWLKSHRKQWYRHHLHLNYSSRAATFSTTASFSHLRQISGLEGPSVSAIHGHSFPQPNDAGGSDDGVEDTESDREGEQRHEVEHSLEGQARYETHPPIQVPRVAHSDQDPALEGLAINSNASGMTGESTTQPPEQARRHSKSGAQSRVNLESESSPQSLKPGGPESSTLSLKAPESNNRPSSSVTGAGLADSSNSMASLLRHSTASQSGSAPKSKKVPEPPPTTTAEGNSESNTNELSALSNPVQTGLVRFNVPKDEPPYGRPRNLKLAQLSLRPSLKQRRRNKKHDGEIVKVEKMLVRIDTTNQQLSDDYNENESMRVETKAIEKWREYVVVCRESARDDVEFRLQLYKSRVVPAVQHSNTKKQTNHEILLTKRKTNVNLYSSLDKTLVIWAPWKRGSIIYIMRPRSASASVEWYTFLKTSLGWNRSKEVQVNVPDLSLTLKLENPFQKLEAQRAAVQKANKETDDKAIMQTMLEEQAVAGDIVKRCMLMLEGAPEWAQVLSTWSKTEKMGLAWKRYDRLEWLHGANEQKMYGTLAMQKSHDLELRPKSHYPTNVQLSTVAAKGSDRGALDLSSSVQTKDTYDSHPEASDDQGSMTKDNERVAKVERMTEPPPIEGFLIRLTSQRGADRMFGKMYFKRLYFSTHNQYLTFCRPAKSNPPPPPKLSTTEGSELPSTQEIIDKMPLIYGIAPFALDDEGHLKWLESGCSREHVMHDRDAFDEAERQVNTLLAADGYIDLCNVRKIRSVARGSTPADNRIDRGDEVDFHADVPDTDREDGTVQKFDDGRTFELVMKNGLIVRLEAFDQETKKEWIYRLRNMSQYWRLRSDADLDLMKATRQTNLDRLNIDEELESYIGQFGQKWEVSRSVASAELYNMCPASSCRTITLSGNLYRKARRHATFRRCSVILCHGQLLIFQSSLRKQTGQEVAHAHHERQVAIDLNDCYVYSGLVTEGDLLYQNQTFDSNHPGRHALPRIFLNDGWTSTDEDTATCFVIWHGRKKSLFRAHEDDTTGKKRKQLKSVTQLGVPGKSTVFKTRSRAERDHWVMNVGMEIERLQQAEEIRVVSK
ncbi:MAG: hypothetical protein M1837_002242 [Sclerophora amabilis]|nr:MAG: hypothetical protein M1837_002242 [Sclerophora amabilis]